MIVRNLGFMDGMYDFGLVAVDGKVIGFHHVLYTLVGYLNLRLQKLPDHCKIHGYTLLKQDGDQLLFTVIDGIALAMKAGEDNGSWVAKIEDVDVALAFTKLAKSFQTFELLSGGDKSAIQISYSNEYKAVKAVLDSRRTFSTTQEKRNFDYFGASGFWYPAVLAQFEANFFSNTHASLQKQLEKAGYTIVY